MLLLALEWTEDKVAKALGITRPTLKKHYFRELKVRDEARARLEAKMIEGMATKALSGDVPAYREVRRIFDRADLEETAGVYRGGSVRAPKVAKLGKKEERLVAAGEVGGMYAPGAPPAKFN